MKTFSKLILHDFEPDLLLKTTKFGESSEENSTRQKVFCANPRVIPCNGCFGCWLKTPGECVIDDRGRDFLYLFTEASEINIISRSVYGSLSIEIKTVMERCLGFMLPFFEDVNGEQHHPPRYDTSGKKVLFHIYSSDCHLHTEDEKVTLKRIASANMVNLGITEFSCDFYSDPCSLWENFL